MICFFQGRAYISFGKHVKAETHKESCAVMHNKEFHFEGSEKKHQMPHESHCLKGYISIKTGLKKF